MTIYLYNKPYFVTTAVQSLRKEMLGLMQQGGKTDSVRYHHVPG